ncbi:hypothetical protein [Mycolicibacterium sarraceniae]|uniref:Uncharacterized protein n=1 Tax=Mycolicibacterium sarraceniae TaxID=1534348 RepID=A0A7I7SKJ9_9MYCO|nr:hypothetical protein [Mycolicibacterium sarraceniae]BBY57268.1 hypothetical protein MSAR_04040 [Mycolicibacterium sarraceniae]
MSVDTADCKVGDGPFAAFVVRSTQCEVNFRCRQRTGRAFRVNVEPGVLLIPGEVERTSSPIPIVAAVSFINSMMVAALPTGGSK